jgi:hypothetical protein
VFLNSAAGWLRQRQRDEAPKLSGSKFIKQASSDSADSRPKVEPENKGAFLICHLEQVTDVGGRVP